MSRTSRISRAVRSAKRNKKKQKKRPPPPAGINPPPEGWAEGEARIVRGNDKLILRVAANLIKVEAKKAERLNAALDIGKGLAEDRVTQADGILSLLEAAATNGKEATVAPHLLRCAQLGVSLEWNQVRSVKKKQEQLGIEDTDDCDTRLRALERLAKHLGLQGSLAIDEEEEEPEEAAEQELDLEGSEVEAEGAGTPV